MADFSIFIDESGLFHSRRTTIGKHLTAAVVVLGARAEAEALVGKALAGAASSFGLPFHACDCGDEARLARHLRARVRSGVDITRNGLEPGSELHTFITGSGHVPSSKFLRRTSPRLARCLRRLGAALRAEVCVAARDLIDEGALVICLEYGQPGGPGHSRWRALMTVVGIEAVIGISTIPRGPHTCEIIPARSGEPSTFDFSSLAAALRIAAASNDRLSAVDVQPLVAQTVKASDSVGLQLADIFAYELGPGWRQLEDVDPDRAWNFTLARLRAQFEDAFPPAVTCTQEPASTHVHACAPHPETHDRVVAAVTSLARHINAGPHLEQLDRELQALLMLGPDTSPRHVYRCSVEGALELVRRLRPPP